MFSLIAGLLKWLFSKAEVHILILGVDHAGKTTLLEQMKGVFRKVEAGKGIPLEKIPPTVGLNIGRMDVGSSRAIFWDLGGQSSLRSIWDKYYSEAHGLMYVVDSADAARFEEAKAALDALLCHPHLSGIPLLFFANKQDLSDVRCWFLSVCAPATSLAHWRPYHSPQNPVFTRNFRCPTGKELRRTGCHLRGYKRKKELSQKRQKVTARQRTHVHGDRGRSAVAR